MMRGIVLISIFTITCALNTNAQVIDYAIDPSFDSGQFYTRGTISEVLTVDNGYLVSGSFNHGATEANGISIVNLNGGIVYNTPNLSSGSPKMLKYRQKFLGFGIETLQWFDPDGTDYSFRFEFQKQAYTGPLSNVALDAIVMPDDNILVAGRFFTDSTLMGTNESHLGLRQLCMIDSTGAPVEDFPMLRCEWPTNAEILRINQLSTGAYIIAGRFDAVEGHPTNNIAKLNADFTVNTDFVSVFDQSPGGVVAVEYIDSNDGIWVNGIGSNILSTPEIHPSIVRLLPDGNLDPDFEIPNIVYTSPSGESSPSWANIVEDTDGTFIISGRFTSVNGAERKGIAKIDSQGNLIPGVFDVWGADEAVWGSWENVPFIGDLTNVGEGKWLAGGRFSSFGGEPYSCLVRLEPNGFVGVDELSGRGKLKIWPNPSGGAFQVGLPDANERIERVEIYDMQGRTIVHTSHLEEGQARIEIHNLAAGIYLVKAGSAKGVYTQKLVAE